MITLAQLAERHSFWKYFFELSRIPRPSYNQEKSCQWVIDHATQWGYQYQRDDYGNILVSIPANRKELEAMPLVAIQAHLDMVCEKDDVAHDFTTDPLDLFVTEDEVYVKANGTTLGADDGIGIAYQMALMDPQCTSPHGPLELLFTLDEEVGLVGATELGEGMLHARYLINIDNSREGMCCVGCAGGVDINAELAIIRAQAKEQSVAYALEVGGLMGGHSGTDIFDLRASALKLTERVLSTIREQVDIEVLSIEGGDKKNAIPRATKTILYAKKDDIDSVQEMLQKLEIAIKTELQDIDQGLFIRLKEISDNSIQSTLVLTESSLNKVIHVIKYCPHGVFMRRNLEATGTMLSTNFAAIHSTDTHIRFENSSRFSNEFGNRYIRSLVADWFKSAGAKIEVNGKYSAWEAKHDSALGALYCNEYTSYTGDKAIVDIIHGGLECGIICAKQVHEIEAISIGPTVDFLHSPHERMHIESCDKTWIVISNMLAHIGSIT